LGRFFFLYKGYPVSTAGTRIDTVPGRDCLSSPAPSRLDQLIDYFPIDFVIDLIDLIGSLSSVIFVRGKIFYRKIYCCEKDLSRERPDQVDQVDHGGRTSLFGRRLCINMQTGINPGKRSILQFPFSVDLPSDMQQLYEKKRLPTVIDPIGNGFDIL
jgi:hypothetical protein